MAEGVDSEMRVIIRAVEIELAPLAWKQRSLSAWRHDFSGAALSSAISCRLQRRSGSMLAEAHPDGR